MTTKVLNLYAGIGGNRKLWSDVDVTAVEWNEEKAEVYKDHFPEDTVVEADAHEYLKENHSDFDFIWASPPCPTHSKMRRMFHQDSNPVYPDMKLYQEILFLKHTFDGDWVVENVEPYYDPLIDGQKRGRHLFWSNFYIPETEIRAERKRQQAEEVMMLLQEKRQEEHKMLEDARDGLSGIDDHRLTEDNPAVENWAGKMDMTPKELLEQL